MPEDHSSAPEKEATTRDVLAAHFVMWRALPGGGPAGEWRCACGEKFGFSDTAIDHVTDQLADVGERLFEDGYEQARQDHLALIAGLAKEAWDRYMKGPGGHTETLRQGKYEGLMAAKGALHTKGDGRG